MNEQQVIARPASAVAAFFVAPLGSALIVAVWAVVHRLMEGGVLPRSLTELDYIVRFPILMMVVPMTILSWLVGGILALALRRRAPFGVVSCALVGAICGGIALYFVTAGLSDPDDMLAYEGREPEYYVDWALLVLLGVIAGSANGLTFWLISRVGLRRAE